MIATRPDWCISRQRIWGVPIAVFLCASATSRSTTRINKSIVELFKKESADAWYIHTPPTCCRRHRLRLRPHRAIPQGDGHPRRLVRVRRKLARRPRRRTRRSGFPADLYTEGGDQHRGWFHSSLLTSVGCAARALPHGRHLRLDARRAGPRHSRNPSATASIPSTSPSVSAARSSASGSRRRLPRRRRRQRKPDAARRRQLPQAAQHLKFLLGNSPLRANRPVEDHRSADATGRPHPKLHRRRSVGLSTRSRRPRSERASRAVPKA
jgi:hypothetical protein